MYNYNKLLMTERSEGDNNSVQLGKCEKESLLLSFKKHTIPWETKETIEWLHFLKTIRFMHACVRACKNFPALFFIVYFRRNNKGIHSHLTLCKRQNISYKAFMKANVF